MDCKECKDKCYPEDPSQPLYIGQGQYLKALCTYCPYYYQLSANPCEKPPETEWAALQWDYVQQLKGQILHLEKKVDELLKRKPKTKSRYS